MTTPDPDAELDAALDDLIGATGRETREEHLIRVQFPPDLGGHVDEYPVANRREALADAALLAHTWSAIGVDVTATPIEQTWVLTTEAEITLADIEEDR